MGRYLVLISAFLLFFSGTLSADAFGTLSTLGQDREHERITRHALDCTIAGGLANCFQPKSTTEISGGPGSFGAVGAPDNPVRGLIMSSAAHCDNGDWMLTPGYVTTPASAQLVLVSCRQWMEQHMALAVTAARALLLPNGTIDDGQIPTFLGCTFVGGSGRAKCNVLEEFGIVLHASEDFYSHTNWVDIPDITKAIGADNPPGLGNSGPSPWLDLRVPSPPFPAGLISGCFVLMPESAFCNDGPGRTKHDNINKDKGTIDPAISGPRTARGAVGGNFQRAVLAAIADTQDKWLILQERLRATYGTAKGDLMICAISHDDPASTCGAPGQQRWSPFNVFNSLALFAGLLGALGGVYYISRGRRRAAGTA